MPAHAPVVFLFAALWYGFGSAFVSAADQADPVVELIVGLLGEKDKDLRSLALEQVRSEAKGAKATAAFAAQLPKLPAENQAALLSALADRGDQAARPAVVELLAATQDAGVRRACLAALGPLGEAADAARLVPFLESPTAGESAAARASLVRLAGAPANEAILAAWPAAKNPLKVVLAEIFVERRAREAAPALIVASSSHDPALRAAAMTALGGLAEPALIPELLPGVLAAAPGNERAGAERAVAQVCGRIESAAQRAAPLLAAIEKRPPSERNALLPTVGRVGGAAALGAVETALGSTDSDRHDAGLRALCNWPDASTAGRLIELAAGEKQAEHQTLALRALIRVAPLPDGRPDAERLSLSVKVLGMCRTDEERKLILERFKAIRSVEAFRFVRSYLEKPEFTTTACETLVELAHHRTLREAHKAEFHAALDKVLALSKDPIVRDRATRYKNNQTWVRPAGR